jgi:HNH endonuclease
MELQAGGYGDQLVAVLSAATDLLADLPARVSRLTGPDLDVVLPVIDRLAALAGAGRYTIIADAEQRGEVASSQAGTTMQWVADRCPSLDSRDAGLVAKAVRELATPQLRTAAEAVAAGRLSVPAGCVLAAEWRQLEPLVEPTAAEAVLAGLVAMGEVDGSAGIRRLRPAMLARYGLGEVLQDVEDRHAGLTVLSCGHDIGGGITEYRLRLNPEARAVVEAAINALSAPKVVGGVKDSRTVDQRRGDALVEVCRRAQTLKLATITTTDTTAAADRSNDTKPDSDTDTDTGAGTTVSTDSAATTPGTVVWGRVVPAGVKSTVLVTIGLDDLRDRTRPGVLVGGVDGGTPLGPETVRKLACDGNIIPVLLGGHGQILEIGGARRAFTSAQVRALWLRDRHCTFPGCTAPGTWCDAHHIRHWADGGDTDLANGTLLCGRHHTIVHRDRLMALVTPSGVRWSRIPGSYDRTLGLGIAAGDNPYSRPP